MPALARVIAQQRNGSANHYEIAVTAPSDEIGMQIAFAVRAEPAASVAVISSEDVGTGTGPRATVERVCE